MEGASERHKMTGQSLDYSSMRREEDGGVWWGSCGGGWLQGDKKESGVHLRLAVVKQQCRASHEQNAKRQALNPDLFLSN